MYFYIQKKKPASQSPFFRFGLESVVSFYSEKVKGLINSLVITLHTIKLKCYWLQLKNLSIGFFSKSS